MFKLSPASFSLLSTLAFSLPIVPSGHEIRVSFEGYGLARIGMSRQDLERALGSRLTKDEATEDPASCAVVEPIKDPKGVSYMFIDEKLARINISSEAIRTVSGASVGSSQAEVLALYPGRVVVTPHFYTAPDGSYLTLISSNKQRGIRFETDMGLVTDFYAGTFEAIQYVEGCQ